MNQSSITSLVAVAAIASSSRGAREKKSVRATGEEVGFTRPKASQSGAGEEPSDSTIKKTMIPSTIKKKAKKKKLGQAKAKGEGIPKTKKPPALLQDELTRLGRSPYITFSIQFC